MMILICFVIAACVSLTYVLTGFYVKSLEEYRIYRSGKILVRIVDLIAILVVTYLSTHEFIEFIKVWTCLMLLYATYFVARINKFSWHFSVILFAIPSVCVIAFQFLNEILPKDTLFISFGIMLIALPHDLTKDKRYKWHHYVSLILGCLVSLSFISGIKN